MTDKDVVFGRPAGGKARARHNEKTCMTVFCIRNWWRDLYSDW
jgi:hypothetical protein